MNNARNLVADLRVDVRHSENLLNAGTWLHQWPKSEEQTYLRNNLRLIREIYRSRHNLRLDRYGWPK